MIGSASAEPDVIACRLIREYGSLAAVLAAGRPRLLRSTGSAAVVARIKITRDAMRHALRTNVYSGPVITNWQAVIDYVRSEQAWLRHEQLRVLYLDMGSRLISDDIAGSGTLDTVHAHAREIMAHALEVGASSLILVHNHPSDAVEPSSADIATTALIVRAGSVLDVAVTDHLIIGRSGHFSFRANGLL